MILTFSRTASNVLLALPLLWLLQGCARISTQPPPGGMGRPATIESPGTTRPDTPAVPRSPASIPPESSVGAVASPAQTEANPYLHVVRWEGETLSLIALWYSASWQNWKAVARANPGLDPDRIRIGDRILIPRSLLKKKSPMPFDFIHPSAGRTRTNKPGGKPAAVTGKIELFRPPATAGKHEPAEEEIELFKPAEVPEEGPGLFEPIE